MMLKHKIKTALLALLLTVSNLQAADIRDQLTQFSTIDALLSGLYDGDAPINALRHYGDFGLGTFNGLDGEMVMLDGQIYQVLANGSVHQPKLTRTYTPFAQTTFFNADSRSALPANLDYHGVTEHVRTLLPTENIFYAIRISGRFKSVKVRSVNRQSRPYPLIKDVVKHEAIFDYNDIEGTVVGFFAPQYVRGINVTGFHMHFISRDKTRGGHILDMTSGLGVLEIDDISSFQVILPHTRDFYEAELKPVSDETIKAVEMKRN